MKNKALDTIDLFIFDFNPLYQDETGLEFLLDT